MQHLPWKTWPWRPSKAVSEHKLKIESTLEWSLDCSRFENEIEWIETLEKKKKKHKRMYELRLKQIIQR